ncbi:MAG: hypothetical protein ABF491_09685, partial [Acetobacter sp.]|uniref:hypothetical protein n=1 Tax=Acetobacter sp. TaxID=440 RepID=UPI0039EA9C38
FGVIDANFTQETAPGGRCAASRGHLWRISAGVARKNFEKALFLRNVFEMIWRARMRSGPVRLPYAWKLPVRKGVFSRAAGAHTLSRAVIWPGERLSSW